MQQEGKQQVPVEQEGDKARAAQTCVVEEQSGESVVQVQEQVQELMKEVQELKAQVGARKEEGTSHSRGDNQWHLVPQTIQNQLSTPSWGKPTVR